MKRLSRFSARILLPIRNRRLLTRCAFLRSSDPVAPTEFPGVRTHSDGNFVAVYTCGVCDTRSARQISKRAYSHGIVLLRCPGCDNLHLLADNIGMFGGRTTAQELLAAHGEAVRRGTLAPGDDGQVLGLEPQDLEALRDTLALPSEHAGEP